MASVTKLPEATNIYFPSLNRYWEPLSLLHVENSRLSLEKVTRLVSICIFLLRLVGVGSDAYAQSTQPQLRAPWRGTHKVLQGNRGSYSHNVCGQRDIDRALVNSGQLVCTPDTWENVFALDIDLASGTDVLAAGDGEVAFVRDQLTSDLAGRYIMLKHPATDGGGFFYTVYMHLSQILITSGQVVQGQVIAKSGRSSGMSETGVDPHLHFHIWSGKGSAPGSPPAYTMAIEDLYLKRVGVDAAYRRYDARDHALDHSSVNQASFESNADCSNGNSESFLVNNRPPAHPAGTLIKTADSSIVYVLRGPDQSSQGVYRTAISTPEAFHNPYNQTYNGDQFVFGEVITISRDEMDGYPLLGPPITNRRSVAGNSRDHPDGRLIQSPKGEVAIISNGQKRPFSSGTTFLAMGYKFCNAVFEPNYDDSKSYPTGPIVDGTSLGGSINSPPPAPTLLSPQNGTTNLSPQRITFSWLLNPDRDGDSLSSYLIMRKAGTSWDPHFPGDLETKTAFYATCDPGASYEWAVLAVDWAKHSDPWYSLTETRSFTTSNMDRGTDEETRRDLLARVSADSRFGQPSFGCIGKDPGWSPDAELSWMDFYFSRGRIVRVFHARSKSDSSRRTTTFYDPDTNSWTMWQRAR